MTGFAHKLSTYTNDPRKPIVFCVYCGQDSDLSSPCPGEIKMNARDDERFMEIFGSSPVKISKELKKVVDSRAKDY